MPVAGEIRASSDGFKGGRIITEPQMSLLITQRENSKGHGWGCLGLVTHEVPPLDSPEREFGLHGLLVPFLSQTYPHFSIQLKLSL